MLKLLEVLAGCPVVLVRPEGDFVVVHLLQDGCQDGSHSIFLRLDSHAFGIGLASESFAWT